MTDNKDALSAFDSGFQEWETREYAYDGPLSGRAEGQLYFFWPEDVDKIRKALTASPSAVVDVSRLREIINSLFWAYGNHAGPNHIDGLCTEALKITESLPDAQGWRGSDVTVEELAKRLANEARAAHEVGEPFDSMVHDLTRDWAGKLDILRQMFPNGLRIIPSPPQPAKDKSK